MANTHVFETKMADRMQVSRYSVPVYAAIASFEEREKLKNGQSVTRPYLDIFTEQDYQRGADLNFPDKTEINETLTVQTSKATPFTIDDLDEVQSNFNLMNQYSDRAMRALEKAVDADFLGEVVNATSVVDASDFGGAAGAGITLDTSNVIDIHSIARRKLALQNVDIVGMGDPRQSKGNMKPGGQAGFEVVNPYFTDKLILSLAGRETVDGDLVGKNGYKAKYFSFDCYESTNGIWTGVYSLATNPTDGDTITINGVTITFVDTLSAPAGAGEVHIATTVDITRANLATFLSSAGSDSVAEAANAGTSSVSAADQLKLARMTATNDNTADTLTLVAEGYGYVVVSTSLTDGTDGWTSEISHQMFGQKGAIDMVLQARPQVKVDAIPKQLGNYVKPYVLYGKKTFLEGANALVNVKLDSSSWV